MNDYSSIQLGTVEVIHKSYGPYVADTMDDYPVSSSTFYRRRNEFDGIVMDCIQKGLSFGYSNIALNIIAERMNANLYDYLNFKLPDGRIVG